MRFQARFGRFFAPAVFQVVISLVVLPLTTRILGPEDYGVFAFAAGFTMFAGSIATAPATFLISSQFPNSSIDKQRELITTLLGVSMLIGTILAILLGAVWYAIPVPVALGRQVEPFAAFCALTSMLMSIPWSVAYLVEIVSGLPNRYAAVVISATTAGAIATLVALFVLELGSAALFAGLFTGSIFQFLGAVIVLRPYLGRTFSSETAARAGRLTLRGLVSNSFESLQTLLERTLLGTYGGFHTLGLYSHAQQYRNAVFIPVKALANAVWPTTLREAKESSNSFHLTSRAWAATYLCIGFFCIGFACFGREIIGLLTNGKFVDSTPYAVLLVLIVLVQFSGRPQLGVLYARDRGEFLSAWMGVAASVGILLLFVLVPMLDATGVIVAIFVQQAVFRLGVQWRARAETRIPFKDSAIVSGGILSLGALGVVEFAVERVELRFLVFAISAAGLAWIEREIVADIGRIRRQVWRRRK